MGLPVHGLLTVVRPATDADIDLLVAWHLDPETSRYWDGETFSREHDRALRAWAKAGFAEQSRHPPDGDHTAEWVLMVFEPGSPFEPGS